MGWCCAATCVVALAGCVNSPLTTQGQLSALQQQQLTASQRLNEMQTEVAKFDRENQELNTQLAQEQQQRKFAQDEVAALKDQLRTVSSQLAQAESEAEEAAEDEEVESLASNRRRIGAKITANNGLRNKLPDLNIPGVQVRPDGDVVRIEVPGSLLFEGAGARLQTRAPEIIAQVADEIARAYPDQIVGVEGHTSADTARVGRWTSNQQLSAGRAVAVFDQAIARSRLGPNQLFVVGHAGNHPVVSNGTPAGRERNSRIEFVVYPERVGDR